MELNFNFFQTKPRKILIYDFKRNKLDKFNYTEKMKYKFEEGNFRIYSWPYCKFDLNIKLTNKQVVLKKKYNFFLNYKNNIFTSISSNIKLQQKNSKADMTEKIRIRNNFYWYNLHYFFKNFYPADPTEADKNQVRKLFTYMMGRGILCPKCRRHFTNYIKANPYEKLLNSSEELFKYTINLHNNVNARNYKRKFTLEEANKMYKKTISFNVYLKLVCKPAYMFFEEGRLHVFPDIINHFKTLVSL